MPKNIHFNGAPDPNPIRPRIADGEFIPDGIAYQMMQERREAELRRQARRHDYLVAAFSAAVGGVLGFLASLLYDLISSH